MFRFIRSELYKTRHRKYPFLVVGIICALALFMTAVVAVQNNNSLNPARFEDVVTTFIPLLSVGLYLTLTITDMVFSEEYKNGTLKNTRCV